MSCETFVYELMENGTTREMTKITTWSQFYGFKVPKDIKATQHTAESQAWIAKKFRAGWITNGGMDPLKVTIVQHTGSLYPREIRSIV